MVLILLSRAAFPWQSINNKIHSYALIGSDFGLLTPEDLASNSCSAEPSPFAFQSANGYPYWQCFEIQKAKIFCDGYEYMEEYGNYASLLVISTQKNNILHEYLSRRSIDNGVCKEFVKDWAKLTRNGGYVCISGEFIDQKPSGNIMKTSWIFDKFKTAKGCSSYFKYGCQLKQQIKSRNCPYLKK